MIYNKKIYKFEGIIILPCLSKKQNYMVISTFLKNILASFSILYHMNQRCVFQVMTKFLLTIKEIWKTKCHCHSSSLKWFKFLSNNQLFDMYLPSWHLILQGWFEIHQLVLRWEIHILMILNAQWRICTYRHAHTLSESHW